MHAFLCFSLLHQLQHSSLPVSLQHPYCFALFCGPVSLLGGGVTFVTMGVGTDTWACWDHHQVGMLLSEPRLTMARPCLVHPGAHNWSCCLWWKWLCPSQETAFHRFPPQQCLLCKRPTGEDGDDDHWRQRLWFSKLCNKEMTKELGQPPWESMQRAWES